MNLTCDRRCGNRYPLRVTLGEHKIGLKLRKEMLQKLKNQVQLYLGKEPQSLRRYALPYKKDIERARWKPSNLKDMLQVLKNSDIVLGGDFHAFVQAQRAHLRLLRALATERKLVLALECIPAKYQKWLDAFMQDKISEEEFLKKIQWSKNWGFSWEQYRSFFELVKKNHGRCIALNSIRDSRSYKNLVARDKFASQILSQACKEKQKEELIYVIFGDLHIAREHLPKQIKKQLPKVNLATVYLNPEKLYFQFFKKNQEHVSSVIQFSKNEFCLLESPPWVKWQSYLIHLNHSYDQFIEDDGGIDYSEHVESLVRIVCAELRLQITKTVAVHSFNNLDFIDILIERMPEKKIKILQNCVGSDISFYLPKERIAFLARGTVNYSAHLAGLIVHAHMARTHIWSIAEKSTFEVLIWQEAMGFFLSKWINPNRKSMQLDDLKKQLAAFSFKDRGEQALKLALDQKMRDLMLIYSNEVGRETIINPLQQDPTLYLRAAKILGAMFGEKIFAGYKSGHLSKPQIEDILKYPLESSDFYNFYIQTLRTVDKIDMERSLNIK